MTVAITRSTRRNEEHPAQTNGKQMPVRQTTKAKPSVSSGETGNQAKTPGQANR